MDVYQVIIAVCLSVISATIVVIGVTLVWVLAEVKNSLKKVNGILDTTHHITNSIAEPVSSFSEFLMGFRNGFSIFNKVFGSKKATDDSTE
ncbi:hypothetical protein M1116_03025 [Patescibacteria group bacterium]|nr:hypothetical protein [Patescibacteria group bacterium]